MLVEISVRSKNPALWPATDLGYVLFKHPDRPQSFTLPVGDAWVCYPQATATVTTCALIVDIDPVKLSKAEAGRHPASLEPYVNDRPYSANSMLASALASVFSTAMTGRCDTRPDAAAKPLSLTVHLPVVAGSERFAKVLFEPLGWTVTAHPITVDTPSGAARARHIELTLSGEARVADMLSQLYILIPVLDGGRKHYFQTDDEADKLLKRAGWLARHPDAHRIVDRYLHRQRSLAGDVKDTLDQLAAAQQPTAPTSTPATPPVTVIADRDGTDASGTVVDPAEAVLENRAPVGGFDADGRPRRLNDARLDAVRDALVAAGARSVADVGCGEGQLVTRLVNTGIERIVALDASPVALDRCRRRVSDVTAAGRVEFLVSAGFGTDRRLHGIDAVAAVDVIEHIDPWRLDTFTASLFTPGARVVVVTTPNAEYNATWPQLGTRLRHRDHRFEWDRAQFIAWCETAADTYGYRWEWQPVGAVAPALGPPTQMAVFTLSATTPP